MESVTTIKSTEAQIASAWARLGVMLNVNAAKQTPDVERLLLQTARLAPESLRMFVLAASWLSRFNSYVAGHRLARLVGDELEAEARPILGLMLEWVGAVHFKYALDVCRDSVSKIGRPLSNAQNRMAVLRRQAEESANLLSKKWGLWLADEEMRFKRNAIRPIAWVAQHNPALAARSPLGDVAASIVAQWPRPTEVQGVMEVARQIGATRLATTNALEVLELAGRVEIERLSGKRAMIVKVLAGTGS